MRIQREVVSDKDLRIDIHGRSEVDLVDYKDIVLGEDLRVLPDHVVAFRDGDHDSIDRCAKGEVRRTDEVSDVLDLEIN